MCIVKVLGGLQQQHCDHDHDREHDHDYDLDCDYDYGYDDNFLLTVLRLQRASAVRTAAPAASTLPKEN